MKRIALVVVMLIMGAALSIFLLKPRGGMYSLTAAETLAPLPVSKTPTATPFQPSTSTPTKSATATRTLAPTPSKTPSQSPTLTPSSTQSPTLTSTPLSAAAVEGVQGRWAAYSLDCESRSAIDWAAYFGTSIDEIEFFNALPVSDNPDLGFVGDVHAPWGSTPPQAYGVHADPVADLLREYGLGAYAVTGMTWDQLRAEISQGRPVIVWVVGRIGEGTPIPYTSADGHETTVTRFEHTVILTGYTKTEVTVLDGYWVYTRSVRDFLTSWSVLGNMAVIYRDE